MAYIVSRRGLMKRILVSATLAPALGLGGSDAKADALKPLGANELNAKALHFVPDASKIDAHANPTYRAGEHCATCAHYKGKATDPVAGCEIFVGRSVPETGWCMVWGARAS